jgi:hypothetical protein
MAFVSSVTYSVGTSSVTGVFRSEFLYFHIDFGKDILTHL